MTKTIHDSIRYVENGIPYIYTAFKHKEKFKGRTRRARRISTGTLYLTSGGRIVIDCGWGEYFNTGDTPICTLDELRLGFYPEQFIKLLRKAKNKQNKKVD